MYFEKTRFYKTLNWALFVRFSRFRKKLVFVNVENPIFNYRFLLIFTLCHFIFILTLLCCVIWSDDKIFMSKYMCWYKQVKYENEWMNEWRERIFLLFLFFIFQIDKQTNINIDVMMLFERLVKVSAWLFSLMKWKYKFFFNIMIVTSSAYGI